MKTPNRAVAFGLLAAGLLAAAAPAEGGGNRIAAIRFWSLGDLTRVSIQTETDAVFRADRAEAPPRIFFDLEGVARQPGKRGIETISVGDGLLKRIRIAETQPGTARVVLDLEVRAEYSVSQLAKPSRIVIELRSPNRATPMPPVRSMSGQQTLAGEPAVPPTAKPEPALLPLGKLTGAPVSAKPEHALELPAGKPISKAEPALDLPAARRAAQPATAKPDAPLDLPPALRARPAEPEKKSPSAQPVNNEPTVPTPAKTSRDREGTEPAKAAPEPDRTRPQAAPEPIRGRDVAAPPKPELSRDREAAEPAKPAPNRGSEAAAPAGPEPSRDREGAEAAKPAPGRGRDVAAPAKPELSRDREAAEPVKPEPSRGREAAAPAKPAGGAALAAKSDSLGSRSLIRALGLKLERIVLDPGHGGHDTGTIGPGGMQEKDLVLNIAQRLGKLIEQRLGSEVVYTRTDDTFIPLEERTAIANERKADLFLSIHANSSRTPTIAGSETFYLNFTTSADELEVAARENATSETSIHELQDLLQNIVKKEKAQESREFAGSIQKALYTGLARGRGKNRGVKKAPFVVLIKASMPSVLAEVAFLSNPREENQLKRTDYRQRVAEALYRGVAQYANTLSHFRTAQEKPPKPAVEQPGQAR